MNSNFFVRVLAVEKFDVSISVWEFSDLIKWKEERMGEMEEIKKTNAKR